MTEIMTERLRLRPFRRDDLPAFVAYRRDPEVARYQSWESTYSMADAERFFASQRGVAFGAVGKWLQLAMLDREAGGVCGDCGVRVVSRPARDCRGRSYAGGQQARQGLGD
jgi:RimJ/RimL family protein N-acetyltransferase